MFKIDAHLYKNRPNSKERKTALEILYHAIKSSDPKIAIKKYVKRKDNILSIDKRDYNLDSYEHIYVAGGGKASGAMAEGLEEILYDRITEGIINVKYGCYGNTKKIKIREGGHPIPDENSIKGTEEILNLLKKTTEKDLVICLISGGASSLLTLPPGDISSEDIMNLTASLLKCGANIREINTLRKHLSEINGGRISKICYPANIITLILSDVIGNPIDVIASGPTAPDESTFKEAMDIIKKYNLEKTIPVKIINHIEKGLSGEIEESPKKGDKIFSHTFNHIIGSNDMAIKAAIKKAKALGFNTLLLSGFIEGEAREVAKVFTSIGKEIVHSGNPIPTPACIIAGGETTVTVNGKGKGGRNQEFALSAAQTIGYYSNIIIIGSATDGTDGPTDASGGIVDCYTIEKGENIHTCLSENNSYRFLEQTGDLIKTGTTNTNVNDLILLFVF